MKKIALFGSLYSLAFMISVGALAPFQPPHVTDRGLCLFLMATISWLAIGLNLFSTDRLEIASTLCALFPLAAIAGPIMMNDIMPVTKLNNLPKLIKPITYKVERTKRSKDYKYSVGIQSPFSPGFLVIPLLIVYMFASTAVSRHLDSFAIKPDIGVLFSMACFILLSVLPLLSGNRWLGVASSLSGAALLFFIICVPTIAQLDALMALSLVIALLVAAILFRKVKKVTTFSCLMGSALLIALKTATIISSVLGLLSFTLSLLCFALCSLYVIQEVRQ